MLRPEPMSRVLVVGPRDQLERVVQAMYALQLVHLVDHRGEDDVFSIGKPLPKASEISDDLVKLRAFANILKVEPGTIAGGRQSADDLRQKIATLDLNLREEEGSRKKIEGLLQDLTRQIEELRPFAALGIPLEMYRGYDTIEALVGRVASEVKGLEEVTREHERFDADGLLAVFVPKAVADKVREHLAKFGFAPLDPPSADGDPRALLARAEAETEKWKERLTEVETRLAKLRERYASFIVRAEDSLQQEIEKAEAPLRFAVSEHSFVIDGWVPELRYPDLEKALSSLLGLHVEHGEGAVEGHAEEEESPPVLLRNRGPAKRFEFLTNLYSTPQHDEIDPTSLMFLLFPVFFGLMIGDAGYGIIMVSLGAFLSWKWGDSEVFRDFFRVVLYGGVCAFFFGLLVFGEFFGIPLHAPAEAPEEISWSAILGYSIPYEAMIHKLDDVGVIDMLLLSIVASFIHLGLGYVVGFVNEIRHDKKHAASRVGWLFVLLGLFGFFAVLGRTPEWCIAAPANEGCLVASHRVVNAIFFDQPPIVWIPADGFALGGMVMPYFSLAAIVIGILILLPTEGGIAPVETISLLANMMSYTRLAGVAVAKGAVALAFNTMLLPLIINEEVFHDTGVLQWNTDPLWIVIGFVFMFFAHALVLILGGVSAGIQSIRLNYVEFFLKFFKGGGKLFSPFGARKTKTEA